MDDLEEYADNIMKVLNKLPKREKKPEPPKEEGPKNTTVTPETIHMDGITPELGK
jgi:hypothetical protein